MPRRKRDADDGGTDTPAAVGPRPLRRPGAASSWTPNPDAVVVEDPVDDDDEA